MALRPEDVAAAAARQETAARDAASAVRLVAGPGTGKSAAIEERVRWLLDDEGVAAREIYVVSFTRASALELRERIVRYCEDNAASDASEVSVTTLHALALRVLRQAGFLTMYPAGPMVLDDWELPHIFEAEFAARAGVTPTRAGQIRREHEAFWSTGNWAPPSWIPPDPPITQGERGRFDRFHRPRSQAYACVLPGEIIRTAVDQIAAGTLDVSEILAVEHFIVDEFQDLNASDLEFVEHLISAGAQTFVAGDDDQSIYSFRFADPSGIQTFVAQHLGASDHELEECFRCTPEIVAAGRELIERNELPNRIRKDLRSLYATAAPPVAGIFSIWRFRSHRQEAEAIAASCAALVGAGVDAQQILVLLSDRNALSGPLVEALTEADVPFDAPSIDVIRDTDEGRTVFSALRTICDDGDYIALRTLLGLLSGVGLTTTNAIADNAVQANQNYRNLFFEPLPDNVFGRREMTALERIRAFTMAVVDWSGEDTLASRGPQLIQLFALCYGQPVVDMWNSIVRSLPQEATLLEIRDILWADNDEQSAAGRRVVYERLDRDVPAEASLPPRVRVMTMHKAKGLSAQVVFIPGLEEQVFPGQYRAPYTGLVLEAARLLYVSVTRARATCVVSFARNRTRFGHYTGHTPSRFIADFGKPLSDRTSGLSTSEAAEVASNCAVL